MLTQSQAFFRSSYHIWGGWECTSIWEGTQLWPEMTQGIFFNVCHHKSWGKLGADEESRGHLEWWCLSSPVANMSNRALISGDGWTPAHPWEWWTISLYGLASVQLLLYLFKYLYLTPWIFSLLPFQFLPPSIWWGSMQVAVWGLVARWS